MGETTGISWADKTWNPWEGCTKVGPGCDGCYAEARNARFAGGSAPNWGPGAPRRRTSEHTWNDLARWDRKAAAAGERPFVFCASLADVFDNAVDPSWRREAFDRIRAAPNLVLLMLTKRIGNAVDMSEAAGGFPANAAIGATFCNQLEYDRDGSKLRDARESLGALFSFGSFEPLLGEINMRGLVPDWVITGGETGQAHHPARPCHPWWVDSLMMQTRQAGKVFHHKQWGDWAPCSNDGGEWPVDAPGFIRLELEGGRGPRGWPMQKVGKQHAGRELFGHVYDERPEVPAVAS